MNNIESIESFEKTWKYIQKMRDAFIRCVPDDKWEFSHHPKYAPIKKQFKHVIKVYGCYIRALQSRKLDMSIKNTMFSGPENRENTLALLHNLDHQLEKNLLHLKNGGLNGFVVDVFGIKMGFSEYAHVIIHHETTHFGIWANYAAFGEFETPMTWRQDWKL